MQKRDFGQVRDFLVLAGMIGFSHLIAGCDEASTRPSSEVSSSGHAKARSEVTRDRDKVQDLRIKSQNIKTH